MSTDFGTVPSPAQQDATETTGPAPRPPRSAPPGRAAGPRLGELVWLGLVVADGFLALDLTFRALAISGTGFVSVATRVGDSLARPFSGIFGSGVPHIGHTTFWAGLLAILVYTAGALVVLRLLRLATAPARRREALQ